MRQAGAFGYHSEMGGYPDLYNHLLAAQIADIMSRDSTTKSDACPKCGNAVPIPAGCTGMWDGRKPNGAKAGGGLFKTTCPACGILLVAYEDLYDEAGKIRPEAAAQSPLHWQRDR